MFVTWIGVQMDRRSSQTQICHRSVVDLGVLNEKKFWKFGHVFPVICDDLRSILMLILVWIRHQSNHVFETMH